MKKLVLLLLAGAFATANVDAQINVPKKNKTLIFKFTADWCPPCGGGGWTAMEGFVTSAKAGTLDAIPVAFHGSSSTTPSLNVSTATRGAIGNNVDVPVTGIPSMVVGRKNLKQSFGNVPNEVSTQTGSSVIANAGFEAEFDKTAGTITVKTRTKFFANASGDYYLAVYAYEDDIAAYQKGHTTPNAAVHGHILRVDEAANGNTWGKKLQGTTFTTATDLAGTYTINVNSAWKIENLHVFTVIWKKTGSTYEIVNANKVGTFPTSVSEVANVANLRVYPNPASSYIKVAAKLKSAGATTVTLSNVVGQNVYSNVFNTTSTDFNQTISVDNITNGVYMLNVTVDGVTTSEKVLINN